MVQLYNQIKCLKNKFKTTFRKLFDAFNVQADKGNIWIIWHIETLNHFKHYIKGFNDRFNFVYTFIKFFRSFVSQKGRFYLQTFELS